MGLMWVTQTLINGALLFQPVIARYLTFIHIVFIFFKGGNVKHGIRGWKLLT